MHVPPSRREFLTAAVSAGAALTLTAHGQAPSPFQGTGRNIVFILIDDMRWDAMSLFGHPFLETPHLDALARGGVICDNAYVTTSLCSPSRASFLSGQYAHVHRVLDNNTLLPPATPTFPAELQRHGYDTAYVGKWHMGGSSDAPQPGFNRWVSFRGQGVYENPTYNIDGEHVEHEGYTTDLLTDYAVEFLSQERDAPFFLYLAHKAVHAEFLPAPRHRGSYADRTYPHPPTMADTGANYAGKPDWVRAQRSSWHGVDGMYNGQVDFDNFARDYAETMRAVDDSVGRVVETLEKNGQLDSTLIVFTSDNGFLFGEHGLIDKRCMYEPSIKIPMIAHCPDLLPAGARRDELVLNIDIAPTLLEAAGLPIPDTVQGRSFLDVLHGTETDWRDAFLYEYFWERNFPQTPTVLGIRTDRYKFMRFHGVWDCYELYDIIEDPHETHNLLGAYRIGSEGGTLDNLIRRQAPEDLRNLFNQLSGRLNELLEETGALAEPTWTDPAVIR